MLEGAWRLFLDFHELDVKNEIAISGDAGHSFASVCKMRGDGESALAADLHANNSNVPALDDLANTKLEREWLALLVRCSSVSAMVIAVENCVTYNRRLGR